MILGGWVPEQKETKSFVGFQGLRELSEKERFPHYAIAMAWTPGLSSESDKHGVEFKLCYLREMLFTVSEPQFLPMFNTLVKALQYFLVSPRKTSRGLIIFIMWLLLTSLVSYSLRSNDSDEANSLHYRIFAHTLSDPGKQLPWAFAWLPLLTHSGPWSKVMSSERFFLAIHPQVPPSVALPLAWFDWTSQYFSLPDTYNIYSFVD